MRKFIKSFFAELNTCLKPILYVITVLETLAAQAQNVVEFK